MGGEGLHSMWLGGFTSNLNRLKIPLAWVSPHYCFAGEVRGGGGGSAVIHLRKTTCLHWSHLSVSQPVLGDFTVNHKQVVNRPKIPQGLSTLLFHRWSEVPSRGGVRDDSL